jgi:hypothetical protein
VADGFTVDRAALAETAQGINGTISALEPLGIEETAGVGRGFSGLSLSGLQVGDSSLASAFGNFCDRWSWGVRSLVQDGNQFAQRLGLAAGTYNMVEEQMTGASKNMVDALVGDPHLSDQQAAAASWSQDEGVITGQETPEGQMTWGQAEQAAGQQWAAVGGQIKQRATDPASLAEFPLLP